MSRRPGPTAVKGATEKLHRRQKRRRRFVVLLFSLLALAIALGATWFFWFKDSSLVAIEQIRINGLTELQDESEAAEIERATISTVGQMTTLNASEADLEEALTGFPRVADTDLRTDFPDSATVVISVREDGSVLGEGSQALLIADDGTILGSAEGLEEELPALGGERPEAGATRLEGRQLGEAILASADEPEQVRVFAERMRSESARLSHLVQDLIDLSRLQADDPLTHAEVIEVDDLVDRMVDEVRTLASAGGVDVIVGDPSGADIFGDRRQIQMALRNLLVNAVSYSSPGTTVAVDARISGSIVEILVKDQGIGIPANELDRIFERFYRVDPARSRATGGTGLGLSIVKHVCQNHGGECSVWSEVGVGSTFVLRLPLYPGDGPIRPAAPVALVEEVL